MTLLIAGCGLGEPICGKSLMVNDVRCQRPAKARLKQIQRITEKASARIGVNHHAGQRMHSRRQLNRINNSFVMMKILGADPGILQNLVPIFAVL